jgi:hypothetical protein
VVKEEDGLEWRFTGIYGKSRNEEKNNTWELLRTLKDQNNLPWLCSGDFNEIMHGEIQTSFRRLSIT